jgi:hypothetical protein
MRQMVNHDARRTDGSECGSGSAIACGNTSCSAALSVPTGSKPLYKKQLGTFLQIFNITRKKQKDQFQNRWNRISIRFYFT